MMTSIRKIRKWEKLNIFLPLSSCTLCLIRQPKQIETDLKQIGGKNAVRAFFWGWNCRAERFQTHPHSLQHGIIFTASALTTLWMNANIPLRPRFGKRSALSLRHHRKDKRLRNGWMFSRCKSTQWWCQSKKMPPQVVPLIFGQSLYKKLEGGGGGIKILYSSGYSWLLCVSHSASNEI